MCGKTVVVCQDVGDFDDYMENGVNALLVDKENPVDEAVKGLSENYRDKQLLGNMGKALFEKVNTLFSLDSVREQYQKMLIEHGY